MSKAPKRIYLVHNAATGTQRLIRACNVYQARNHAARDTLAVAVATQEQLVALLTGDSRVPVEDASDAPAEQAPLELDAA